MDRARTVRAMSPWFSLFSLFGLLGFLQKCLYHSFRFFHAGGTVNSKHRCGGICRHKQCRICHGKNQHKAKYRPHDGMDFFPKWRCKLSAFGKKQYGCHYGNQ